MPWSELVVVNGFTLMFCLLHDPIWNCTSLFSHDRDRIIVLLKRVYSMALELPFSPGLRIYSSLQEEEQHFPLVRPSVVAPLDERIYDAVLKLDVKLGLGSERGREVQGGDYTLFCRVELHAEKWKCEDRSL
eukprot:g1595.t1